MMLLKIEKSQSGMDKMSIHHIRQELKTKHSDEEIIEKIQDHLYPRMTEHLLCFVLENKFNVTKDRMHLLLQAIKNKYGENLVKN